MNDPVLTVLDPGLGAAFQDQGRHGWRRFGVPPGGAMDARAAEMANRLLGNPPWAPVIELLLQGAAFLARRDAWFALTGADMEASVPAWRAFRLRENERLVLPRHRAGVWAYLAVEGGFSAPHWLDSASTLAAAGLGQPLAKGDALFRRANESRFVLPHRIAGRLAPPAERRDYLAPPPLRVWKGPQWEWFDPAAREAFFAQEWVVSAQSNRAGYRLEGTPVPVPDRSLISEPILLGSIQLPPGGQPLVILNDGPTVGGYPKIALLDPDARHWLVQCRPGQPVRFTLVEEAENGFASNK